MKIQPIFDPVIFHIFHYFGSPWDSILASFLFSLASFILSPSPDASDVYMRQDFGIVFDPPHV